MSLSLCGRTKFNKLINVIYIYILDTYRRNDNRRKNKGRGKASLTYLFTSHFIARVPKGCSSFACERVLETEQKLHILTPLLWPSRCVFLVLLNAQPEVLGSTAGCWLSLLHLISIFSGPQLIRALSPIGLVWLSLPHLVSNSLEFYWQLLGSLNSTQLYNNSTPTRSPTGSLKSDV